MKKNNKDDRGIEFTSLASHVSAPCYDYDEVLLSNAHPDTISTEECIALNCKLQHDNEENHTAYLFSD